MLQRPTPATDKAGVKGTILIAAVVLAIVVLEGAFAFEFASRCANCRAPDTSFLPAR